MNSIGLEKEIAKVLIEPLNDLLANFAVFYQNTRGLHWNIKGDKFFELHVKFEELYDDLKIKVDEVAERILTLEGVPLHTYQDFVEISEVKSAKNVTTANEAVNLVLESFQILLVKERKILALSDEADDEGTNALMSDYIREQEKLVWMYRAYSE